jgi:hypothetical protein
MENKVSCKVIGNGDICLDTDTECQLVLRNAKHIPNICLNLVSTRKLNDKGYYNSQSRGKWKLSKQNLTIARGKKTSTRYNPNKYVLLTDGGEPESYSEDLEYEKKEAWLQTI